MAAQGNGHSRRALERDRLPARYAVVALVLVAVFAVLSARLYDVQIVRGLHYQQLAEQNRLVRLPVPADRGIVYDREGRILVRNKPGFAVRVIPADLPRARQAEVAGRLGEILGLDPEEISAAIDAGRARAPYEAVRVTRGQVDRAAALLVEERRPELPGVRVVAESIREYLDGPLYSAVMGYVGPLTEPEYAQRSERGYLPDDVIGRTGIERTYEDFLRGTYGAREVERDAALREIRMLSEQASIPGANLVLTLDDRLQRILADQIAGAISAGKMSAGVGVAMDPRTGEILALVSMPAYDNNLFVRGITSTEMAELNADPGRPLVNKAIADMYPPGSTFKLVTGLAALQEGVAHRGTTMTVSSNVLRVGGFNFFDWRAHGTLDFLNGFAYSSDIYYYTLAGGSPLMAGPGVGPDKMAEYGRALGFGAPTGIDIPGEIGALMPDPAWKRSQLGEAWTLGNTYHAAIGQGFVAVTPLQLLVAYAAVANGGTVYRPHVLREVVAADGTLLYREEPEALRQLPVDPQHLRLIREGARRVVTSRMAYMPDPKLPVAGKTGTAEFGETDRRDAQGRQILAYHNWFVSWVPDHDSPDAESSIAMVVFAYNSSSGCQGGAFCPNPTVEISQKVYEAYLTESQARTP